MRRFWLGGVLAALAGVIAIPAAAQTVVGAKSGVINWVEGSVWLNEKPYAMQPTQFGEVKEGMVLRAGEGRAEVLLPPGVFFRIAENSSFKMISNRLIDTRVELLTGSGILEIDSLAKEATVTVVAGDATVSLKKPGIYRVDAQPARLKVFAGAADIELATDKISAPAGRMLALGVDRALLEKFDIQKADSFDNWSRRRAELLASANISAARQSKGYPGFVASGADPCGLAPVGRSLGVWQFNPYYGVQAYVPCQGSILNPYGFNYWSPPAVYAAYFSPTPMFVFDTPKRGQLGGSPAGYVAPGHRGFAAAPAVHTGGGGFAGGGVSAVAVGGGGHAATGGGGGGGSAPAAVSSHSGGGARK